MSDYLDTDVYTAVRAERVRADRKHGDRSIEGMDPFQAARWLPILMEEVGEVARALDQHTYGHTDDEAALQDMHGELVQVAAMALAWADSIASWPIAVEFDPVIGRLNPVWMAEHNARAVGTPNQPTGEPS